MDSDGYESAPQEVPSLDLASLVSRLENIAEEAARPLSARSGGSSASGSVGSRAASMAGIQNPAPTLETDSQTKKHVGFKRELEKTIKTIEKNFKKARELQEMCEMTKPGKELLAGRTYVKDEKTRGSKVITQAVEFWLVPEEISDQSIPVMKAWLEEEIAEKKGRRLVDGQEWEFVRTQKGTGSAQHVVRIQDGVNRPTPVPDMALVLNFTAVWRDTGNGQTWSDRCKLDLHRRRYIGEDE